jgi:hypothetical protein
MSSSVIQRFRAAAAALLLLAAGACGSIFGSDLGDARDALRDARSRWDEAGISSYEYTVSPLCFCGVREMRVTVSNGQVVQRVWTDNGQPVPAGEADPLGTVEDLFATLEDAIDRGAANVDATYDIRGVPRVVGIDYSRNVADEEFGWNVPRFTPGLVATSLH